MTVSTISLYVGEIPNKDTQQPAAFTFNYVNWVNYQKVQIPATNTTITEINAAVVTAKNNSNSASDAALTTQSNADFKGVWSSLSGALNIPSSVENNGDFWKLLVDLADVTASEPSSSNSDWLQTANAEDVTTLQTMPETLCRLISGGKVDFQLSGSSTITRGTTKTIIDGYGILATVPIDELAINSDGASLEGAGENVVLWTSDFQNAVWTIPVGTGTTNYITGQTSGANAVQFIATDERPFTQTLITLQPSTTYHFSAFLEDITDIGSDSAIISITGLAGQTTQSIKNKVSDAVDGYVSLTFTTDTDVDGTLRFGVGVDGTDRSGNVTLSQVQLEVGTFRTSNMPSDAAVGTRDPDNFTAPVYNNLPPLSRSWWFACELKLNQIVGEQTIVNLEVTRPENIFVSPVGAVRFRDSVGRKTLTGAGVILPNTTQDIIVIFDEALSQCRVIIDDVAHAPVAVVMVDITSGNTQYGVTQNVTDPMFGSLKHPQFGAGDITDAQAALLPK
jgi:hypothetical protein